MIDRHLVQAATALTETLSVAEANGTLPEALRDLCPLFGVGLVHTQRNLLQYLLEVESDWPWND
jgi:hypothetical protein